MRLVVMHASTNGAMNKKWAERIGDETINNFQLSKSSPYYPSLFSYL